MRHLHFDCFSGISGDMTLGALLDLGASETVLREGLALLPLPKSFELRIRKEPRQSIIGTRVEVLVGGFDADEIATGLHPAPAHLHEHAHDHHGPHDHLHGSEAHSHSHAPAVQPSSEAHLHSHEPPHPHGSEAHQAEHAHLHDHKHDHSHFEAFSL